MVWVQLILRRCHCHFASSSDRVLGNQVETQIGAAYVFGGIHNFRAERCLYRIAHLQSLADAASYLQESAPFPIRPGGLDRRAIL